MIQVQSFTFNPFQENTYCLINEQREVIVIDPGMYGEKELKDFVHFITEEKLTPVSVLLTHAHLDHLFGLKGFLEHYNVPFYLHPTEELIYKNAEQVAATYGVELILPKAPYLPINEKEKIIFGQDELSVRLAPGHSPGSVCFISEKYNFVIAGDVLFQMSIGRTDLPFGDFDTLIRSIHTQLFSLDDRMIVYPGHGPSTTIGLEKMNNPYLS